MWPGGRSKPFLKERPYERASEPYDRISKPVSSTRLAFVRVRLCNGPARQKRKKDSKKENITKTLRPLRSILLHVVLVSPCEPRQEVVPPHRIIRYHIHHITHPCPLEGCLSCGSELMRPGL
ncbi:hypothetical protein V2G26_016326 [Clonostachys chloroleuca]